MEFDEFLSYMDKAGQAAETMGAVANTGGQMVGNAVAGYRSGKADGANGANVNVKVKDEGGGFAKIAIILGVAAVAVVVILRMKKQ